MKNTDKVRNARFWIYWNGGFVKLTLRPEQSVEMAHSEPNDEGGYSAKYESYRHDGDGVYNEWERSGRDCDGSHSEGGASFASLDKLAVVGHEEEKLLTPEWEKARNTRCYDQYAEAMNY